MGRIEHYLNAYEEDAHNVALNNQNVYVSYSGDYKANPIFHVHNSCELLFFEEGEGLYKIKNVNYRGCRSSFSEVYSYSMYSLRFDGDAVFSSESAYHKQLYASLSDTPGKRGPETTES